MPKSELLSHPAIQAASVALIGVGGVLVLSSMYQLGITGTYLGDYCGIYMQARVTAFPFNILNNPMYDGSTLNFIGLALWYVHAADYVLMRFVQEAEPSWSDPCAACVCGVPNCSVVRRVCA